MSRSNGPVTRGTAQSHDWQHAHEPDPSAQPPSGAAHQPYQWPALNAQQPNAPYGYGHESAPGAHDPHGHDPHGHGHHGHAPQHDQQQYPAYHFPQQAAHQPAPQPNTPYYGGQQPAPQPQSPQVFTTQFEQYLTANQQRGNAHAQQGHGSEHDHSGFGHAAPDAFHDDGLAQLRQPQAQPPQRASHASLRDQLRATQDQLRNTQEQLRTPQQFDQWQQPQHDNRNYDLGSYMPASAPGQPAYGAPDQHHQGGHYDQQWQDPHAYGNQPFDHQGDGYYPQHGESLPVAEQPEGEDHDDGDYEVEEPRRGRRGLVVVGALVGAIIVGGGMAYGYKMVVGPGSSGSPPVIKADNRPTKTQPAEPGGKQFAHTDSKLMGRLEADGSGGAAQNAEPENENGVRRVSTVMVGRDGSIGPPAEPRLPQPTVSVPGMTIVDGFGGRTPPSLPPPRPIEPIRPAPQAVVPPAAQQPPTPAIISRAVAEENQRAPQSEIQAAQSRVAAVAPAAPPTPQPPVKRAAVREEAPAPAPSAPITRSGASTGFVAVLSSQRSRMDALKTFADLQQRYTSVLQNKIPDVQEADLSARGLGMMYRVVVGPPGSREAANDVCGQLRNAGFQGCWVTAY